MQATVQKWGNSLALRLPKPFTSQINIDEHSLVEIILEGNQIIIKPIRAPEINLDELLAAITPENLHVEILTGDAVGKEIW
jgi:antitoxin MazE